MTAKIGLGIPDPLLDKREKVIAIARKYGALNLPVFSSVAQREANQESDIYLLVNYDLKQIKPCFLMN